MIKKHSLNNPNEPESDFTWSESVFEIQKVKYLNKNEINSRLSSSRSNGNHLDINPRPYYFIFYDSILLQKDVNLIYTSLFYFNLLGFSSYQTNYNAPEELFTWTTDNGKSFQQSQRMQRLRDHQLLDYIKTAILLRDSEAKAFYESIEPRVSTTSRYYFPHEQDLEQLLIFLCGKDDTKILTHLKQMQSFDYLGFLKTLTHYQTSFCVPIIQHLLTPFVAVISAIFEDKKETFNTTLEEALLQHKAYYESLDPETNNESRRGQPEGWVSLLLTCACAIAYERGFERTVSSDYIPEWLVKGEFEGLGLVVE
jgi:hypothetical protein